MRFGIWWIRVFEGLTRGGVQITKSFHGDSVLLLQTVSAPKRRY